MELLEIFLALAVLVIAAPFFRLVQLAVSPKAFLAYMENKDEIS